LEVGKSVAIVAEVEPLERLDLRWSVSGTSGGELNTDTGEQVVYTAGKEGTDIVVAEGTTASGAPVKQTVTLTIIAPTPTATLTPTNTFTPTPTNTFTPTPTNTFTPTPACESFRPQIKGATDFAGDVEIVTPEDCTTNLEVETRVIVAGTYDGIPEDVDMWVLVYPPSMVYYPQSPRLCEGAKMDWGNGKWTVPVELGEKGGEPEWHDIVVVLVDQETSQFFSDWGREGCQSEEGFLGIVGSQFEEMNITEKAHITVQTQE
jgi:hypothetical protein